MERMKCRHMQTWQRANVHAAIGVRCQWPRPEPFTTACRKPLRAHAGATRETAPFIRQQQAQAQSLDRVMDGFNIDSLATLGYHGPEDIRGLVALEPVNSAALVTVPLKSTLAVSVAEAGGQLIVLAPEEMPPNVKKAIEVVARLVRETPEHQIVILAILLLWARKYGSTTWKEYCEALLPPPRELSCLLCYSPGELQALQLSHLVNEASHHHDWARWVHSKWSSSSSGALRKLELADAVEDTLWALAVVRSRAVEFPMGVTMASASVPKAAGDTFSFMSDKSEFMQQIRSLRRPMGPVVTVLVPVVDLANHSNDPNCVVQLTTDMSKLVLLPRRPVAAGEPLTVDYGFGRSSLELMADYGFVMSGNPHDGNIQLPGADKLPPLELPRLEAAARALLRRWQRAAERRRGAGDSDIQDRGSVELEDEKQDAGGSFEFGVMAEEMAAIGDTQEAEAEAEMRIRGRIKSAVALLAPKTATAGGGGGSTPATQRIIAGLWHKLVRHCADILPTSLEQDRALLLDILAARVSGFSAGPDLSIDPGTATRSPPSRLAAIAEAMTATSPRNSRSRRLADKTKKAEVTARSAAKRSKLGAAAAKAAAAFEVAVEDGAIAAVDGDVGSSVAASDKRAGEQQSMPVKSTLTHGTEESGLEAAGVTPPNGDGGEGAASADVFRNTEDSAAGGEFDCGDSGRGEHAREEGPGPLHGEGGGIAICRTGRRAGRLYAGVRARLEHKVLLFVAEELLLLYGRN